MDGFLVRGGGLLGMGIRGRWNDGMGEMSGLGVCWRGSRGARVSGELAMTVGVVVEF